MTIDLSIRGAEGIARVAADVRRLGASRVIVNEMAKEIRGAVPPIRDAIKVHEVEVLPHRGGLGAWVARGRISARVRRAAKTAGVKLVQGRNSAQKRSDLKRLDAGSIRHPVHGNRKAWALQTVPAGAFTKGVTDQGVTEFRQAVVTAVDNATAKVMG